MDILERARKIARRYMDENPPVPLKMRAFYDGGVRRGSDYRYHADMDRLFPQAKMGDRAFVRCLYTADGEEEIGLTVTLFGPAVLRVNGAEVFRSNIFTERNNHTDNRVDIHMNPGENLLELELTKTPLGFGCIFERRPLAAQVRAGDRRTQARRVRSVRRVGRERPGHGA